MQQIPINNDPDHISVKTFQFGECVVFVSIDDGCYHLSISHPSRLPTYYELKTARYKFCPDDCYMAQVFPPKAEFMNIAETCLHLWEVKKKDGKYEDK